MGGAEFQASEVGVGKTQILLPGPEHRLPKGGGAYDTFISGGAASTAPAFVSPEASIKLLIFSELLFPHLLNRIHNSFFLGFCVASMR